MEGGVAEKTAWRLTQNAFDALLRAFDAEDRERAGEKYLRLRMNLVRFFEGRGAGERADEAADEVCNRLARKIEAGETFENVNQYAYGVARMVALELHKTLRRQEILHEYAAPEIASPDETEEERLKCLSRCLAELPADNRRLIIAYYRGERREKIENRQKLADELGIPNNALRNRAVRLRDKLEACIEKCTRRK